MGFKTGFPPSVELEKRMCQAQPIEIGPIVKPCKVRIVPIMTKNGSGKIMCRVLGSLSNKTDVGNMMTLANPEIMEAIKKMVKD